MRRVGGHPAGDPLLPAVELVNAMRLREGVRAGQVVTTGTYTRGARELADRASVALLAPGIGTAR